MSEDKFDFVIWDWKAQPNWETVNQITTVTELQMNSDDYGVVFHTEDLELTAEEWYRVYNMMHFTYDDLPEGFYGFSTEQLRDWLKQMEVEEHLDG